MENTSKCTTLLLSDDPVSEDVFGSHQRLATAISHLIATEDGGRSVALRGPWGSGKSTTVNLLKISLKAQAPKMDCELFIFDAWEHQGDSLRRAFLEQLIHFLAEKGWVAGPIWHTRKELLARRLKITSAEKIPQLTIAGTVFALSLLLTPVGLALVSSSLSTSFVGPCWLRWLGWTICLLPVAVVSCASVCAEKGRAANVLALLLTKSIARTRNETVESPEPTSIEFQLLFRQLLSEALKSDDKRRLSVVIDNLDRIDSKDALSIWATMRTFFNLGDATPWLKRFWLVVPFDPLALNTVWGDNPTMVESFSAKAFQVSFSVPRPVLSDWHDYFSKQLLKAIPNHKDSDDCYLAFRLFQLKGAGDGSPTPRDIKLFINRVGGLHRQWGDEIPLHIQALFVLFEKELIKPEQNLIRQGFLGDQIAPLIKDPQWQNHMAALYYNVPSQKANQILLQEPVAEALATGDLEALKERQDVPGFQNVCEMVIGNKIEKWVENEPECLARAASLMPALKFGVSVETQIWNRMIDGLEKVRYWHALDKEVGQGIAEIMRHVAGQSRKVIFFQRVLLTISKGSDRPRVPSRDLNVPDAWIAGVSSLVELLDSLGHADLIQKNFKVPGDGSNYLDIISRLMGDPEKRALFKFFKPSVGEGQIVDLLAQSCNGMNLSEDTPDLILALSGVAGTTWAWGPLITALQQRLSTINPSPAAQLQVGIMVRALLALVSVPGGKVAESALTNLAAQGQLAHHFYAVGNEQSPRGALIAAMIQYGPNYNGSPQWNQSANGNAIFRKLCGDLAGQERTIVETAKLLPDLLNLEKMLGTASTVDFTRRLIAGILKAAFKLNDAANRFEVGTVCTSFPTLKSILEDEALGDIIRLLIKDGGLITHIEQGQFELGKAELYFYTLEHVDQSQEVSFRKFLAEGFRHVDADTWQKELKSATYLLKLALEVRSRGTPINLTTQFEDALLMHASLIITNATPPNKAPEYWPNVFLLLSPENAETFLRNLRDRLITQELRDFGILNFYGKELTRGATLDEKADELVRTLMSEIASRGNSGAIQWLRTALDLRPGIMQKCQAASAQALKNRIITRIDAEDVDPETKGEVQALAKALKL